MKLKSFIVVSLALLAAAGIIACSLPTAPATPPAPAPATPVSAAKPAQSELDRLVAAARQEGSLLIAGQALGATSRAVADAFRAKFRINIEFIESGSGSEIASRIMAQRRAGLYLVDGAHTGDSTFFVEMKPNNITVPLEPLLFLPEVTDGSKWRGGKIPFVDKDRNAITFVAMSIPPYIVNNTMVQPNEVAKHTDLLNPKWKGKIVFTDPTTGGTGNNWFTFVVVDLSPNRDEGLKFMQDFAKQEPVITRDYRLLTESVARGKYPIGIGPSIGVLAEFQQAGAPIGYGGMGEKTFYSAGPGMVYVFDKAPHPNAVKLYVNWLLSKEGAQVWAPAHGYPSLRMDVDNSHIDPALIPSQDAVFVKPEGYIDIQSEMRTVSRKIFENAFK